VVVDSVVVVPMVVDPLAQPEIPPTTRLIKQQAIITGANLFNLTRDLLFTTMVGD